MSHLVAFANTAFSKNASSLSSFLSSSLSHSKDKDQDAIGTTCPPQLACLVQGQPGTTRILSFGSLLPALLQVVSL